MLLFVCFCLCMFPFFVCLLVFSIVAIFPDLKQFLIGDFV